MAYGSCDSAGYSTLKLNLPPTMQKAMTSVEVLKMLRNAMAIFIKQETNSTN